jgi:hypothetical protein
MGRAEDNDDLPVVVRHPVVHVQVFISEHSNDAKCWWCVLLMDHLQRTEIKREVGMWCVCVCVCVRVCVCVCVL